MPWDDFKDNLFFLLLTRCVFLRWSGRSGRGILGWSPLQWISTVDGPWGQSHQAGQEKPSSQSEHCHGEVLNVVPIQPSYCPKRHHNNLEQSLSQLLTLEVHVNRKSHKGVHVTPKAAWKECRVQWVPVKWGGRQWQGPGVVSLRHWLLAVTSAVIIWGYHTSRISRDSPDF